MTIPILVKVIGMKICLFFNTPSIYREAIYKMIDKEYDCDWFLES